MWAQNEAGDTTPAQQYQALLKEYQQALRAFQEAARNAKTAEEQQKAFREKYPQKSTFAPKFVELAEKNPKDPVALDALLWVMTDNFGPPDRKGVTAKAVALLKRDHIESPKLAGACQSMTNGFDKEGSAFLRAVLEKNPHKEVQAEACLALAQRQNSMADIVSRFKSNPAMAKAYAANFGNETIEQLLKTDVAEAQAEATRLFQEFADKHAAEMKVDRLVQLCQTLGYSGGKGSDALLRSLLEKDKRREVQGVACLTLGKVLKQQAERLPADDKTAASLRAESEKVFEQAQEKYADVKMGFYGTVGAKAKAELFDLRHLSVGKAAPEVEGVDQDGKKFKLSDYRGKVVFLDFWSQY